MTRSDHEGQRQLQEGELGLQRRNQPFCMYMVITRGTTDWRRRKRTAASPCMNAVRDLERFLSETIKTVDGVERTETLITLSSTKETWKISP
jgi:hypothetical protein